MERRLYHLDFLRAFALFIGVFYRSAHADAGAGDYDFVRDASGAFRMACFFLISGYFSVALIERKGTLPFLKGRLVMLTVPALVCVILLAPFTAEWMASYYSEVNTGKDFKMFWMYHAWFLFSLLAYTLVLTYTVRFSKASVGWLTKFMPENSARIVLFAAVVVVCALSYKVILPSFMWDIPYIHLVGLFILISVQHFPYFLLGVFMFLWRDVYEKFNSGYITWGLVALVCIAGSVVLSLVEDYYRGAGVELHFIEFFAIIYEYLLAILLSIFLCAFGARFLDKDFWIVRAMAQSAYTVYVVHFVIVAFLLFVLQRIGMPMDARMLLSAVGACLGGMLFHFAVVKRFKLTSLLFNGKLNYGSGAAGTNRAGSSIKV
ncbi:acyltransferase family protein [Microbulbifer hydrolyticus]|uniref:Acyltransferase family protein n=1 Tax=Microbulbifer hydrolyticus TaxID=48074 RepID=A0A6P1TAU8_9GAMM|nr:acyltransferase family protein [Microbulbifer hydrolyticus]MBB5212226.1 glucan biosynthesis protein C [Microbulbifer hydrolyticus]QHQ39884.1 acyltransferase family protein [Microbulbifer hydrolyticus]